MKISIVQLCPVYFKFAARVDIIVILCAGISARKGNLEICYWRTRFRKIRVQDLFSLHSSQRVSSATVVWYQRYPGRCNREMIQLMFMSHFFRMRQIAWIVIFMLLRTPSVSMEHDNLCSKWWSDELAIKVPYIAKCTSEGYCNTAVSPMR